MTSPLDLQNKVSGGRNGTKIGLLMLVALTAVMGTVVYLPTQAAKKKREIIKTHGKPGGPSNNNDNHNSSSNINNNKNSV